MTATSVPKTMVVGVSAVMAAAVIAAFVILGTPAEERTRRIDERRVEQLSRIASAVEFYRTRNDSLPPSLEALARERGTSIEWRDPVTEAPYEYRILGPLQFELCAVFDKPATGETLRMNDRFWSHDAGRQCFQTKVAPPKR